jgi:hypothetical protein
MGEKPEINDGGPVFPEQVQVRKVCPRTGKLEGVYTDQHRGMTLRDWLAGQVSPEEIEWYAPVTQGDCRKFLGVTDNDPWDGSRYMEIVQIIKYRIADAMLAAREVNSAKGGV